VCTRVQAGSRQAFAGGPTRALCPRRLQEDEEAAELLLALKARPQRPAGKPAGARGAGGGRGAKRPAPAEEGLEEDPWLSGPPLPRRAPGPPTPAELAAAAAGAGRGRLGWPQRAPFPEEGGPGALGVAGLVEALMSGHMDAGLSRGELLEAVGGQLRRGGPWGELDPRLGAYGRARPSWPLAGGGGGARGAMALGGWAVPPAPGGWRAGGMGAQGRAPGWAGPPMDAVPDAAAFSWLRTQRRELPRELPEGLITPRPSREGAEAQRREREVPARADGEEREAEPQQAEERAPAVAPAVAAAAAAAYRARWAAATQRAVGVSEVRDARGGYSPRAAPADGGAAPPRYWRMPTAVLRQPAGAPWLAAQQHREAVGGAAGLQRALGEHAAGMPRRAVPLDVRHPLFGAAPLLRHHAGPDERVAERWGRWGAPEDEVKALMRRAAAAAGEAVVRASAQAEAARARQDGGAPAEEHTGACKREAGEVLRLSLAVHERGAAGSDAE
jgi:hypothetical protein